MSYVVPDELPGPIRVNPGREAVRRGTSVVRGVTRFYHDPGFDTPLTLKTVMRGAARYRTRSSRYLVEPHTAALFNRGQRYELEIDTPEPTETLAVFFAPGFLGRCLAELESSQVRRLDEPVPTAAGELEVVERGHGLPGAMAETLGGLRGAILEDEDLEPYLWQLGAQILRLEGRVRVEMEAVPAVRASTREELYRRLHRARDYLLSCYAEPLTVSRLAAVANLSPFHFQRSYRQLFGKTPAADLRERRLRVAARLLGEGAAVTEACLATGFTSLGSFSSRFRRRFGVSPNTLRPGRARSKRAGTEKHRPG